MEATTKQIAEATGASPRAVRLRARRERWAYRARRREQYWDIHSLPADVQARLAGSAAGEPPPPDRGAGDLYGRAGEANRRKARLRVTVIGLYRNSALNVEDFVTAYNAGSRGLETLEKLAGPLSARTLYRWLREFDARGPEGVTPRYGLKARPGGSLTETEKGLLEGWYLSPARLSASHCWRNLLLALPDSRASYQTVNRYLKNIPKPKADFHRLGATKFESLHQPYIDRNPALYAPMEQAVSDHHCFDFLVIKDGKVFRPWITVFQDYRSSKILGFWVSVYPSSLSIMAAFYRMAAEYGAPEMIHIDNGKDYRSKIINGATKKVKVLNERGIEEEELIHLHGAFGLLRCGVTFSRPYHGQSKGRTERTFGTFAEYFSKETGTYIGSNTVARHEDTQLFYRAINGKAKRNDLYAWDDFVRGIEAFIPYWNARWRGEGKGMDGKTPDEVFFENLKEKRIVDHETLLLTLTAAETRKVRENGVRLGGVDYWSEELIEYSGQEVMVRLPVVNPNTALVMDLRGKPLCTARANWFGETGDLAADNERVNRARKSNLEKLKKMGVGSLAPPEGKRGHIAAAEREAGGKVLALPPVFETDGVPPPPAAGEASGTAVKNRYISPLDIGVAL